MKSFHGRWRDECLNREQLWTLTEARVVIEAFRCEYNERRPYGKLSYQSPARFAAQLRPLTPTSFVEAEQTYLTQLQPNQPSDQLSIWLRKAGPVTLTRWSKNADNYRGMLCLVCDLTAYGLPRYSDRQ